MKRGTPEHPKMLDLAEAIYARFQETGIALSLSACETLACGTLERLYHYAARYAPAGDVGKHSNIRLAKAIGWEFDADWIVETLLAIRWLDSDVPNCRLYVHDWHIHCEDLADRALADNGLLYANGAIPRNKPRAGSPAARATHADGTQDAGDSREPRTRDARVTHAALPCLALPSHASPVPQNGDGGEVDSWKECQKKLRAVGVSDAVGATSGAKASGVSTAEVLSIIAHWESMPGAWAIGALHARIKSAMPGEPASDHWPDPSDEWNAAVARKAREDEKRKRAEVVVAKRQEAIARRKRAAELEPTLGAVLDSMSVCELDDLIDPFLSDYALARDYQKHRAKSNIARPQLLLALAAARNGHA